MPGITLLGLGPGDPQLMTRQAWEVLQSCRELYLRTSHHPVVTSLPDSIQIHAFDSLFDSGLSIEMVCFQIVEQVLALGQRPQGVIYAVPGHPYVAEDTSPEIARRAQALGISVRVVEGLSFLEPTFTALGLTPLPHTAVVDALTLAAGHMPPFPTSAPAIIAQLHSRVLATQIKQALMSLYPGEHNVQLVHAAGTPQVMVELLALQDIDRSERFAATTSLYLPPLGPTTSFEAFLEIIAHLRAPDGCPWDREQTHQTLRTHLLEETYEVLAALDDNDSQAMREEFGDLLLQVVLHAQIASEYGEFNMAEILHSIHTKIVSRHPHVFGDLEVKDAQGVLRNWERLKAEERAANGKAEASLLDGVGSTLPALLQAEQYQRRAAHVGFDWPDVQGVLDKLEEELQEVHAARDGFERYNEIGDLLFAVVNLARWYKIEPESALREANRRFRLRFGYIERQAREQGRAITDLSLDEMEALWQAAKRQV